MNNKTLMALLFCATCVIGCAGGGGTPNNLHVASETPEIKAIGIQRHLRPDALPAPELGGKRIFIEFEGSEKASKVLQEKLRRRGFAVAETAGDADAHFKVDGVFSLVKRGKTQSSGKLGELLEASIEIPQDTSDWHSQPVGIVDIALVDVAISRAVFGYISPTNLGIWISDKVGVRGWFNKMLTGDPDGFCVNDDFCKNIISGVFVYVKSDAGHWWIKESAKNEKIVLDLVIEDALDNILKPIYDTRPAAAAEESLKSPGLK
ncbi:MAG: hypothetical protein LBE81_06130 [Azonexus sp.]|jgi:hypothetical protein|uniref:hypothetical protein n=1 Tax=Azonexus sp. TaxID=1872668 RepID=UPI0028254B89|nr:hypothetical protein [Azonexus sp.]MDR0776201.1 hypothetical protein [Azonexus sp.]